MSRGYTRRIEGAIGLEGARGIGGATFRLRHGY